MARDHMGHYRQDMRLSYNNKYRVDGIPFYNNTL